MRYCTKCVQPDSRPGIQFDEHGVCPPCRFAEKSTEIDWEKRRQEIEELAEFGRQHNVCGYDCIIGVSGGKDSVRQSMFVRDELNLKPLLVSCTYPPEQQTERGAYNLGNLISLGFDCISVGPSPQIWKTLMRQGFLKYGNWCRSTEMALYASAPKVAVAYHIPLIFLGENPAIALGDLNVGSVTGDANKMKHCHTLGGGNPDCLLTEQITEKDILWYRYSSDEDMELADLKIRYLGYYIKDFTRFANGDFAVEHGLQVREDSMEETGSYCAHEALDEDFVVMNQMMKYVKFGFGKVTDQVSEAVRLGMMTREQAVDLARKYDGNCGRSYIERFCRYIEITEQEFWDVVERYRNKEIWEKDQQGQWNLKVPLE